LSTGHFHAGSKYNRYDAKPCVSHVTLPLLERWLRKLQNLGRDVVPRQTAVACDGAGHRSWRAGPDLMSAFGGKADINGRQSDVCFWPKADIGVLQFSALGEGQEPESASGEARGGGGLAVNPARAVSVGDRTIKDFRGFADVLDRQVKRTALSFSWLRKVAKGLCRARLSKAVRAWRIPSWRD
jgi:hypothetical protein